VILVSYAQFGSFKYQEEINCICVKMVLKENFDFIITNQFVFLALNKTFMKRIITILLLVASLGVYAQPRLLTQAIVTTKTTIVTPESDEAQAGNFTSESGERVRVMRFGGDGETKTTTWLKADLVKTYSESEMAVSTSIRDNSKKITTTIVEAMGRKSGFYVTDEEQEEMRKRVDSMMSSRMQANTININRTPPSYSLVYVDENKKIAGYDCKKALMVGTLASGKSDTTLIWYCPDFKLKGVANTGGAGGGFGGFSQATGINGMEDLAGFPLQYERNTRNGGKMTVQVTKLVIDKEIADKEFEVPKDIEIKPMKDMQNSGQGNFQFRMGG
jgi:hypothetical protein